MKITECAKAEITQMKRIGNLYDSICDWNNILLAESIARRGKSKNKEVIEFDENKMENLLKLQTSLIEQTFKTSNYKTFIIQEQKERIIQSLPYFPDRIVHHAIMNIIESFLVNRYSPDTYSCIKGRGIHLALRRIRAALQNRPNTKYCLKLDIKKFYPNIKNDILKVQIRRIFKDEKLLMVLDNIIDSANGLPIGNYTSQHLSNVYLTGLDRYIKQDLKIRYYFRYADDMVLLSESKEHLHEVLHKISAYLKNELELGLNKSYQVFPVESRGIDFIGYKFYHNRILVRKRIKKNFCRMMQNHRNPSSQASYIGWLKHANTKNLIRKVLNEKI